jgi:hypothetical protein
MMTEASLGARDARRSSTLRVGAAWLLAVLLSGIGAPAGADQVVGSGGVFALGGGRVDLSCTDLIVAGTLNLNQGTYVNVRNVNVLPGGTFNGGSGAITYSGALVVSPGGLFLPQAAQVTHNPLCLGQLYSSVPIPTLWDGALLALAVLVLWLANLYLGEKGVLRHRGQTKGQGK